MLGTTFKLGFDGSAVNRGMRGIGGMVGKIGGQIGLGMSLSIGHALVRGVGSAIRSIAKNAADTFDWGSEMSDISAQTGIATESLIELSEALRLAGAMPRDIGRTLSQFKMKLHEAATVEGSAAGKALNDLRFSMQDFKGMPIDRAFFTIGQRISDMGEELENVEGIVTELFGGIRSVRLLRFFKDYNENMAQMRRNTGSLGFMDDGTFRDLDRAADALGRWEMVKRTLTVGILKGIGGGSLSGFADVMNSVFDKLQSIGPLLAEAGAQLRNTLRYLLEYLAEHGLVKTIGKIFTEVGLMIGRGIGQGIKETMSFMPKAWDGIKKVFGGGGWAGTGATSSTSVETILGQMLASSRQIERNVKISKFA
jgi:hypothetical protein